jgi:Ca2+-binding RTX toxin-like protein
MYGGTEDDTYIVDDENDEVIEYENEGDDRVESSITYSLTENVESLILTETDHIDGTGNSLDNYIFGNDGNNTLNGEAGNDDILGYLGDDTLYGGDNDDYLTGGEGDDVLYGGSDNDVLYGEDGYFLPPLQRHLVERLTER